MRTTLGRHDLRPYQERIVEHIKRHTHCALWVDMGLGKTASTLTAFDDLLGIDARRMLVVAPLRVARDVWDAEVRTWSHLRHLTVSKIIGSESERMAAMRTKADIHTINRENVQWLEAQFIQNRKQIRRWPWDMIVLDEASSFKSQSAKRWKSMSRLRRLANRVVELTGTPTPQGYADLWAQIYLLDRGERLGRSEGAYRNRWFDFDGKWILKKGAKAEIQAKLADIVLTMRSEDYLDLPPVTENVVRVALSGAAMRDYRQFERDSLLKIKGETITAVNAGVLTGKLLQFASGAIYHDDAGNFTRVHDAKLEALAELLEFLPTPVLIAYTFKHDVKRIGEMLTKAGMRWEVLRSAASMTEFASGGIDYGIIHPASAGHGLNDLHLSGAQNIVWFGPTSNGEWHDQLNARLAGGHRRIGKNIVIHTLVASGTWDERAMYLLRNKGESQAELVKAMAGRVN